MSKEKGMTNFECNVIKLGEGYLSHSILHKSTAHSHVILVKSHTNARVILLVFRTWECSEDFIYHIHRDRQRSNCSQKSAGVSFSNPKSHVFQFVSVITR